MSRCFPYPPPGYEPRPRSESKDLLKKEKDIGKKHRKENGREKEEKKRKDKGKGERKGNDRGHKKLKREKRREKRKNKDRERNNHQTSEKETQKIDGFDNRRLKDRRKHETVKDIERSDDQVSQILGQAGHANNKASSTSGLLPQSSKGFGATASKDKEGSVSTMVKESGHAAQHCYGMVQKNYSIAYANKKGADDRKKNGKNLQVGSGEKHSRKRHGCKVKQMEKNGDVEDMIKADLMHLASLDVQTISCDDVKKRKELDADILLHENGKKTTKLPRMSPVTCVNGKTSLHSQGIASCSSTELVGTNAQEVDWHEPQGGYNNGITDSRYLELQQVSVSSPFCDGNEGDLKPPHPDAKYLIQVQYIPPRDDISECINQDWLFSGYRVETTSLKAAEPHQVWSDAQLIDTVDVVALPYVIPL